ncbi:MAG: hypothetical protein ABL974_00085 [Prosthecobacter sp.]
MLIQRKTSNAGEINHGCLVALVMLLGLGVALFALLIFPLPSSSEKSDLPFRADSDDSSIQFFLAHQEAFEQLRHLIEAKKHLEYYDLKRDEVIPKNAVPNEDLDRLAIRQLMTNLGLSALNGPASDWGLRMIFQSEGMVMSSSTKSFYFSHQTPPRLVPSIENFVLDAPESEGVYRKIVPNWYLKLDWGG